MTAAQAADLTFVVIAFAFVAWMGADVFFAYRRVRACRRRLAQIQDAEIKRLRADGDRLLAELLRSRGER